MEGMAHASVCPWRLQRSGRRIPGWDTAYGTGWDGEAEGEDHPGPQAFCLYQEISCQKGL